MGQKWEEDCINKHKGNTKENKEWLVTHFRRKDRPENDKELGSGEFPQKE